MTNEQPLPSAGAETVTPHVRAEFNSTLDERVRRGIETYGRTLETFNGRDAGRDAWEELVDLAQYVMQLRLELDAYRMALARSERGTSVYMPWVTPNARMCRVCDEVGLFDVIDHAPDCPFSLTNPKTARATTGQPPVLCPSCRTPYHGTQIRPADCQQVYAATVGG